VPDAAISEPDDHTVMDTRGAVRSIQAADLTMPASDVEELWTPLYLERLARTYWRFLTRASLGLIRVKYSPDSRDIVLITRPLRLLTFHAPEYDTEPAKGTVTWRIKKGLLVAPHGRGKGYLRISVDRREDWSDGPGGLQVARVVSEVGNFYPTIAGWGWFATIGRFVYRVTQLAIHAVVTNAFFRSLARLDLAPSVVGKLRQQAADARGEGDTQTASAAEKVAKEEQARVA
jgi:hypothetical protein